MEEQKKNNFGMKVLSVFIAILVWLLVANTNDPVMTNRITDIPVQIINEDVLTEKGYAYEITEGDKVSIRVKGKKSIVGIMDADDFQAVADLSKLSDVDAVPIDVTAKKYADQLEITLGTVNTLKIKRDKIVSVSVPVNIVVNGDVEEGYAVGSMTGTPNLVKVTGPENLLSSAKEILAEVDVDKISGDITTTVKPVLYDNEGAVIDSSQIEFDTSSISVSIELWKTKEVEVQIDSEGTPKEGYVLTSFDYEPKKITVAAPENILNDLESITMPSISLDGVSKDYEEDIDITQSLLPDDVILADDTKDVKIKATIEKVVDREITFLKKDITVKGGSGYEVAYDADNEYVLTVEGAASLVNGLEITDLAPWIELTDLEAGEHRVTVHVKKVDGVTVESIPKIGITLKE